MRILSAQMLNAVDCSLAVEVNGDTYNLIARGIRRDTALGGVVGGFDPWPIFRELPLSAAQVRALTRTAVESREGACLVFPFDVPP